MMDIGHMTHFIQEMLPALKWLILLLRKFHELVAGGTLTHIVS
jgi:hypothetical protein